MSKEIINEETEEVIIKTELSSDDDTYGDSDLFTINSWGADLSFRELTNMYDEDELQKPELQRYYVWDKREASRFIESILLGLPVPSIFLARTVDEDYLIVDGYQRIMTVYDYINGVFTKDKSIFKLTNNVNDRWKGKTFNQLDSADQKRIKRTTIHAIIFEQRKPEHDDTSMYQIFERINTGGRSLSPQEIRNCVYHNDFNQLLFELNQEKEWRKLYGMDTVDPRMKDMEFILRFLMLSKKDFKESNSISLKKELNLFMDMDQNGLNSSDLIQLKNNFKEVTNLLSETDEAAFQNLNMDKQPLGRFHPTIFDSIAIATLKAINNKKEIKWVGNQSRFRELKSELLDNQKYEEFISKRTTNTEHIYGRINLAYEYLFED
ncbi:hypothetical protein VL4N_03650 [Vagococcus lutrae]|uniref:DUF262 domain-containing protein n=1 Tax=Vagococcus lutrae TaxID=81947 RepID=UPI00192774C4|nr:DUF262 domain-containing protein [Vagococcus lutrae]GEQ61141.1 hypothetical protein VL2N_04770 [Vagococcus lutrae]GEQ63046.1 hypothetical protein VL3N_04880 [Vagococcus lutrae]GEQ64815.1 hypothetical protein VL4N_03650 [Vagococcus lutrae]